jgi:HAMP domain-containing protein
MGTKAAHGSVAPLFGLLVIALIVFVALYFFVASLEAPLD